MSLLDDTRRAKARLTDMMVQECSVVDAAANLRKFVLIKRDDTMGDTNVQKEALKLPSAAKQGIMDGLAQALDKLTALATLVGDAEVDDAAAVPPDLGAALNQTAELMEGMAAQYCAAPPTDEAPPAGAEGEPPPPAAGAEGGVAPPAGKSVDGVEVGKGLPSEQHDGESMKEQHDGDSLSQVMRKAVAAAHIELASLEKAGRKIATARYKKLSELHDTLGKLLNELAYDDAAEAAGASASDAKKDAGNEALKKAVEEGKAAQTALATKLAEQDKQIAVLSKQQGVSNSRPVEGGGAPPQAVVWPFDMSAALKKNKAAKR